VGQIRFGATGIGFHTKDQFKTLQHDGVDRIFAVAGEEKLDDVESLRTSGIELVPAAPDGYTAPMTKRPPAIGEAPVGGLHLLRPGRESEQLRCCRAGSSPLQGGPSASPSAS